MKITIDEKICLKHKMTLNEVLIALAVRTERLEDNLENMVAREILVDNEHYQVTQHWSDVIDEIICDSSQGCKKTDSELVELALRVMQCFPEGKMKDRFGRPTPYYYRCNKSEVSKALKRFFTQFGSEYSDDAIVNAAKRYVASFNGNYTGMRIAKYFIMKNPTKQDENGKGYVEQVSDLLTFLENGGSEEEVVINNDDWLTTSRN
jgi:hypothetical protein